MRGKFILSRLYLTLFVGFLFVAIFTMTYTQGAVEGTTLSLYDITIRQIMFASVGFMILFMSVMGGVMVLDWKNKQEPDPMDLDKGWMVWGVLAMIGARIGGSIITQIPMSSIGLLNGTIALTSAIFEEPIFCGIGLMFFSILLKFTRGNEKLAIIGSTAVVAGMFAIIHIGVYGFEIGAMLYLAVGRIIYNYAFLRTRTLLTPTIAHLGHNFLIAFLGV